MLVAWLVLALIQIELRMNNYLRPLKLICVITDALDCYCLTGSWMELINQSMQTNEAISSRGFTLLWFTEMEWFLFFSG